MRINDAGLTPGSNTLTTPDAKLCSRSGNGLPNGVERTLSELVATFKSLLDQMQGADGGGPGTALGGPTPTSNRPSAGEQFQTGGQPTPGGASGTAGPGLPPPGPLGGAPAGGPPTISAGSGPNSVDITNTSGQDQKIGMFLHGGSTATSAAEITLKPGQTGTLSYENGQGGFIAKSNSEGAYQPDASRLEFFADASGTNNTNVSYITGRNASISVQDGQGKSVGDTRSIAAEAPASMVSKDGAGNPTITGWYDGSSEAMRNGGSFLEQQLGTGNAYIHPDDDQKRVPGTNPMTMAGTSSQHFTATFGET